MDPVSKAQNSQPNNRAAHLEKYKFKPRQSGNPGGRPKKQYITKIYEDALRNGSNRKEIKASVMDMLRSKRMVSVLLLREMAERTEGKVVQPVDMEVSGTISLEQVLEAKKKAGK